ncbi:MAG: hypothetical protein [Microvirus sp.]|nr:MAG: hypothetical protein [Microvirus sp.]
MALRQLAEALKRTPAEWAKRIKPIDNTPIEVTPSLVRPINCLDDLRKMMYQLQKETADNGNETFEEFWDFGDEADFDDLPAPAQLKAAAIDQARNHDFEADMAAQRERYQSSVAMEARRLLERGEVVPPLPPSNPPHAGPAPVSAERKKD